MRSVVLRIFSACMATILVMSGGAQAQVASATVLAPTPDPPGTSRTFAVDLADAIVASDFRAALELLESRSELAADPAAIRLRAQLLASLGRVDEAAVVLEGRLTAAPDDVLARFQLGEIHFTSKRDRAAEHAYRLALAGGLDPARRTLVAVRLSEIRDRQDWVLTTGLSIAPDSNINGGANAATIEIFGLPFDLDEAARRRSGFVLSANGGVERRIRLSEARRLLFGVNAAIVEVSGRQFDSQYLAASLGGEQALSPQTSVSVKATLDGVWLGGELVQTLAGGRISLDHRSATDVVWDGFVRAASVEDRGSALRSGQSYSFNLGRTRYLTASSLVRTSLFAERRSAGAAAESYTYLRAARGWLIPLPKAVSAYIEPYAAHRGYDGIDPFFGVARRDRELGASVRLAKRDWIVRGAFPFIAVGASRNDSNLTLHTYTRHRFEFGFTRQF